VAFAALAFSNVYGDPSRWSSQPSAMFTLLSFLNPRNIAGTALLLMTLGPALLVLRRARRQHTRVCGQH